MTYKLLHDYQNTYSLLIQNDELWDKMPEYSPRYLAKPKAADWVTSNATFFASKNYEGDPAGTVPDVCTWSTGNLVLNEVAYNVFRDLLEKSGEFLPICVSSVKYYVFNTLLVIPEEGINKDKAVDVIDSGVHLGLDNVTFKEEVLDGAAVFKSDTDLLVYSYCTNEFKRIYEINNFKGLIFEEVKVY